MSKNMIFNSLKNHFLIAMPSLTDPYFFRSVIYLFEHTENGALGIIINQPLPHLTLGNLLGQMGLSTSYPEIANRVVFNGGPVQPARGFVLHDHTTTWQSTTTISDSISLTTSPDILHAIANNAGPKDTLITLGFVNWESGQLEKELGQNHWLYGYAKVEILFHTETSHRWRAAAATIGVDLDRLSDEIGHA